MMKKNTSQWKGLDALFLENTVEGSEKNGRTSLKIGLIEPKSGQPRKTFEEDSLSELAASVATYGILQPILVRELPNGKYQIVAGERRWRASKLAGLSEVPAIILSGDEKEAAEIALVENIQREDLNPVEEAMAYRSLLSEYGMTQEELAAKIGKSRSAIANAQRLLDLPEELLALIATRSLSAGHARALLSLPDAEDRALLARQAIAEGWSVRTTEEEVKRYARRRLAEEKQKQKESAPSSFSVNYAEVLEQRLMRRLGRRVRIEESPRKKCISFYYENNEDLDEFLRRVCGENYMEEDFT